MLDLYSHVYIFCRPEKEKTKNGKTRKTKSSHRISSENRFFAPDWHRLKNQKSINNLSNHRPFSKRVCIVDLDHNKAWKRRNQKKTVFQNKPKKIGRPKKSSLGHVQVARLHEVQGVANQTPKTHLLLIQPTRTATTAGSKTSNLGSSVISIETTRKPRFLR